jgi:hypothetical protein
MEGLEKFRKPCCGKGFRHPIADKIRDGEAVEVSKEELLHIFVHESEVDGCPIEGYDVVAAVLGDDHPLSRVLWSVAYNATYKGLKAPTPEEWEAFMRLR